MGGVYKGVRASVKKKKVGQELGKMGDGEARGGEMCEQSDVDKGGERIVKARRSVREEGKGEQEIQREGEVIKDGRINEKQEQSTVCAAAVTADTT